MLASSQSVLALLITSFGESARKDRVTTFVEAVSHLKRVVIDQRLLSALGCLQPIVEHDKEPDDVVLDAVDKLNQLDEEHSAVLSKALSSSSGVQITQSIRAAVLKRSVVASLKLEARDLQGTAHFVPLFHVLIRQWALA